jgi:SAM-dependent methyltransferase
MAGFLGKVRNYFRAATGDQRAFATWGERAKERQAAGRAILAWTDSLIVSRRYIHPAISGLPESNWLDWAARRFFRRPAELALSIGSGDGGLERHGLSAGLARRFEAFDASPGAVELARQLAGQHGVADRAAYFVADLNDYEFEPTKYDAAFASMAVHHIRELQHFFSQVQRALKPGGLFIVNEFVGPNQFQWTDRQMELANDLLNRIPERYRRSLVSGHVKSRVTRQTIANMNAVDPTEAVRSADIIPLMQTYFDLLEQVDYGGTLLNLVLEEIAGNFDDTDEDLAVLTPLFDAERRYIETRVLPSDFTVLVARSRERH